jgi:hypothetical protein
MNKDNKRDELENTDKKLHISDVMCWFGFHRWNYKSENGIERKCKRCGKHQKRTVQLRRSGSDYDNIERWLVTK